MTARDLFHPLGEAPLDGLVYEGAELGASEGGEARLLAAERGLGLAKLRLLRAER